MNTSVITIVSYESSIPLSTITVLARWSIAGQVTSTVPRNPHMVWLSDEFRQITSASTKSAICQLLEIPDGNGEYSEVFWSRGI